MWWAERTARLTRSLLWPSAILSALVLAGCERERAQPLGAQPGASAAPPAPSVSTPPADPAGPSRISPEALEAAGAMTGGADIRRVVTEIADDRYAGRAPGTPGDKRTRAFLAAELETLGFEPGAPNGSYEQPVELVGVRSTPPATWRFSRGDVKVDLKRNADYIAVSGVQTPRAELANAELVFVGYGIEAPEYGWDDFKGVDVAGKVLVMLNNDPDWDPALFAGTERLYYGRWTYKYESAARHGAAGAIIVHTTPSAGYPWQVVQASWSGAQFHLPAGDEPHVQVEAWITEDAARRLLGPARNLDGLVKQASRRDFVPVPLGIATSLTLRNAITHTQSANVLGRLRGSDAALADELVIYSAHHDHLGVGEPNPNGDPNDKIYNGARDNASGVGMVLAIGKAFASLPQRPRRSIALLFPAAEEQGLLGSQYFAAHPAVPPGKIAANVNYDSGNIWGATNDITFIGLGKSSLDGVAAEVAAFQQRALKGDQFPDRGSYYRSDQFNFAKIGVPAFYFSGGTDFIGRPPGWGVEQVNDYTDRHYHQPSDELTADWSFDGMVQDAQFGFYAGLIVANDTDLPAWNPGNEFEPARRAALGK
ncbi:MAG TPA: M28 family peptidase [Gammaproteobacteria bacterium]|nr:M28 family peptidase [Gammaproteobacteria bacterium]